jgi:hypothetical protein
MNCELPSGLIGMLIEGIGASLFLPLKAFSLEDFRFKFSLVKKSGQVPTQVLFQMSFFIKIYKWVWNKPKTMCLSLKMGL